MNAIDTSVQVAPVKSITDTTVMYSLTRHIRSSYEDAKTAKQLITERLLKCDRQRRGEYEPAIAQEIKETGGTEIYMMLTDIKCRAAESWIKDVMMSAGVKSFTLEPNQNPDMPEDLRQTVIATVVQEAMEVQGAGMVIPPGAVQMRTEELYDQINDEVREEAKKRAERMEDRIQGILQDADFDATQSDFVDDFVTYPTAILKGPVVKRKAVLSWGPNWTPEIKTELVRDFSRVSPYNIFPSRGSSGPDDGYIIERHRLQAKQLETFIDTPGYNNAEIKAAILHFARSGFNEWISGDFEKDELDGKHTVWANRPEIEAIEFWGPVSGQMLKEWGMKGVDDWRTYEINAWTIGPYTIRAVINSDPLGRRGYSTASFIRIPGAFWGKALPESMSDVQTMCNAAARALANNMAVASGPQVEVDVSRVSNPNEVTSIYPWKVWTTTADKSGSGQPAVRFFQPAMNAGELLNIYTYFQKIADEVTGVPNYIYGSSNVSGAGRTASGLAMLMENAAKGIKHAILAIDRAMAGMVKRVFEQLMRFDPDPEIKGDMKLVPNGVVAALLSASVQEERNKFLAATANPIDMAIIGETGRATLLRTAAETLDLDVDDVVPSAAAMKRAQAVQQAMAAQAQEQVNQQMAMQAQMPRQRVQFQRDADGGVQGAEVYQ